MEKVKKEQELLKRKELDNNVCYLLGTVCALIAIIISIIFFKELFILWWEITTNIFALVFLFVVWGFMTIAVVGIIFAFAIVGLIVGIVLGDIIMYYIYDNKHSDVINISIRKKIVNIELVFLGIMLIICISLGENYFLGLAGGGMALVIWKMLTMPCLRW